MRASSGRGRFYDICVHSSFVKIQHFELVDADGPSISNIVRTSAQDLYLLVDSTIRKIVRTVKWIVHVLSYNSVIMHLQPLFGFYAVILSTSFNFAYGVVLETKQGVLKGELEKSRGGRSFYSFYGIPYAEPPIGKLRFEVRLHHRGEVTGSDCTRWCNFFHVSYVFFKQAPVAAKPWEGVRDATILPSPCWQHYVLEKSIGNEDCLYLNLYKPKVRKMTERWVKADHYFNQNGKLTSFFFVYLKFDRLQIMKHCYQWWYSCMVVVSYGEMPCRTNMGLIISWIETSYW